MRAAGTDLGVLAEVAGDQRAAFRRIAGPGWALVAGGNAVDNVVVYRRAAFTQVAHSSMTTRYNGGQRIHVRIPVLRDNATGTEVAVIPVHNPQWHVGPWRTISLRLEMAKIRQLRRAHHDWQIIIAGDFNAAGSSACGFLRRGLPSPAVTRRHCERLRAIDQMYATPSLSPHGYRSVHTDATDHHREYHAKLVL
jgi:endonuclease/exonuclease/phosphatase (EEP) superfamily protein YafD